MIILEGIFITLAMASLMCLVAAFVVKRRNIGFMLTATLIAVCDILCMAVIGEIDVSSVRLCLTIYYICHAWMYFGVALSVAAVGRFRSYGRYVFPIGLICVYQTLLILSNTLGNRVFDLVRHIYLGRTWWVAVRHGSTPVYMNLDGYYFGLYAEAALILIAVIAYSSRSDRLFKTKYAVLFSICVLFILTEMFTQFRDTPVWIACIVFNVSCFIAHYYINYYSGIKLKNWSLTNFANEMSDGFILYDEYDDPIHMNALIKNILSTALIEEFQDRSKLDEWLSDTVRIGDMDVKEFVKSDGEKVFFTVRKDVFGRAGYVLGTVYMLHDSTDLILRMSTMEESNTELERATRMKSDFLANMSHEIRTPMNAVIGMAEMALREPLPPKVEDYLRQIQSSGRNLLNIINDILDFSKIEAGKMEIMPAPYEPAKEIEDIVNVLRMRIGDKGIDLFVDVDKKLPRLLEGDAMRIRQILLNLAGNAIKFTKEGCVCIKVECNKTSDEEVDITYHVTDTGMGIRQEDMDKLFNNFEQVDSKRNREVEGTGLGLPISKRLCEAMNGRMEVTSEYGKGSDFFFVIPQKILDPATVTEDEREVHKTEAGSVYMPDFTAPDARILVVDDNSVNLMIARGLLEPVKAEVVGVDSGRKAIDILNEEHFDLVLMDHMMPIMDGVEATKIIRETVPGTADLPIIAFTANVVEDVRDMFLREGMNGMIAKPIDVRELMDTLRRFLPADKIVEE